MLVFVHIRVDPKDMSLDRLWDIWEEEAKAALEAMEAGKIVSLYKICGQLRFLAVMDMESYDELDRVLMAGLPMARYLIIEEVAPIREYEAFASDIMQRWQQTS